MGSKNIVQVKRFVDPALSNKSIQHCGTSISTQSKCCMTLCPRPSHVSMFRALAERAQKEQKVNTLLKLLPQSINSYNQSTERGSAINEKIGEKQWQV